jgi:hypothetical protein
MSLLRLRPTLRFPLLSNHVPSVFISAERMGRLLTYEVFHPHSTSLRTFSSLFHPELRHISPLFHANTGHLSPAQRWHELVQCFVLGTYASRSSTTFLCLWLLTTSTLPVRDRFLQSPQRTLVEFTIGQLLLQGRNLILGIIRHLALLGTSCKTYISEFHCFEHVQLGMPIPEGGSWLADHG